MILGYEVWVQETRAGGEADLKGRLWKYTRAI